MRNAVIPYAIIAVLGIVAVIIISAIGMNQRADIAEEGNGDQAEQVEVADGESLYQLNCAACHGADLAGGAGPELTTVGANYSQDEIKDIIQNGIEPAMPAFPAIQGEELEALSTWLSEKQ